jgi:hypothetical protein
MASLALVTVWLGLFPSVVLNISKTAVLKVIQGVNQTDVAKTTEVGVIHEPVNGKVAAIAISKTCDWKINQLNPN